MRNISYLIRRAKFLDSRLIVALDLYTDTVDSKSLLIDRLDKLLEKLTNYVAAIKIGLPTILCLGIDELHELLHKYRDYYFIADMKISDVGHIDRILCRYADRMGFDAVISHAIIGLKNGLEVVVDEVHSKGGSVFTVCAMSHPGAEEILNTNFSKMLDVSLKAGVDGFILPATQPKYIQMAREKIGREKIVISPGVVHQGAEVGIAIEYGADFEIIGRGVYLADDPVKAAQTYASKLRWSI